MPPKFRSRRTPAKRAEEPASPQCAVWHEIAGIALVFLAVLGFLSFWSGGEEHGLGYYLRVAGVIAAGRSLSFLPLLYLLGIGVYLIWRRRQLRLSGPWLGFSILCLVILSGFDLASGVSSWSTLFSGDGGGVLGGAVAIAARRIFTTAGAWLFLGAATLVALLLITGRPLVVLLALSRHRRAAEKTAPKAAGRIHESPEAVETPRDRGYERPGTVETADTSAKPSCEGEIAPQTVQLKLAFSHQDYILPSTDLLSPRKPVKPVRVAVDQRRQLEETLASFGVQAKVIDVHRGPVITRYDLQPAAGVKVSRIVSLADDLALALAARGLRIEAPIPGKAAVGIEVPNKEAMPVTLREVIESRDFAASGCLDFALGLDIAGEVVLGNLGRMPHLLIAGATGSGKSVCLNTIIMSLLFKAGPDRIKMIMIDPKMVELTGYNGIPHLIAPVVTDAKRAPSALKWAVGEMEQRYKLMMQTGAREIEAYNKSRKDPASAMAYIVIFIDELADLMMVARLDVEDSICRLAQMARATGIHLVIATQRPSVDVITGLIKANIPSRIAFAVSSLTDSRTILDSGGAERLLGRGDMLYAPTGVQKPRRVQGAFVDEDEVSRVVDFLRKQAPPESKPVVFKEQIQAEAEDPAQADELFWQAVQVVVDCRQASASVLQRRLRVGYSRAARLVDLMEAKGFVGPFEGSKPREVRVTAEELAAMRER
ncbi:MAG: DNA translocase FtsK [Patescibacteria group bacterium]